MLDRRTGCILFGKIRLAWQPATLVRWVSAQPFSFWVSQQQQLVDLSCCCIRLFGVSFISLASHHSWDLARKSLTPLVTYLVGLHTPVYAYVRICGWDNRNGTPKCAKVSGTAGTKRIMSCSTVTAEQTLTLCFLLFDQQLTMIEI